MAKIAIRETDLYEPIKTLLEGQGYEVKGEVGPADVVAVRDDEAPVVVELKTGFSLALLHQAIERQSITDHVYVAVPRLDGRSAYKTLLANRKLCRRLGLGLITVRMKDGFTEIMLDPGPYSPRKSKAKKTRLLKEFAHRVGDPNKGGADRKSHIMTAYRQDAIRCARCLVKGPLKASEVAQQTQVARARPIMADDHYGWFERVDRGIYGLTPKGREALADYV